MHAHDEAQLTFAASGMMQVHTERGRWLVPPQLAVWAPAGVPHQVEVLSDAELWMIYWQPSAAREWAPTALLGRAFALRVTPLLRALIAAAFAADITPDKAELIVRLILHELTETLDAPTFLPLPTSVVGRRVADLAFADHRNRLDVAELASPCRHLRPNRQPAVPRRDRADIQGLAAAGADRPRHRPAIRGRRDLPGVGRRRLRQHRGVLLCLPTGDGHDAYHVHRRTSESLI